METTPDKYCRWKVTVDYLQEALGQIHRSDSTIIAILPHIFETLSMEPPLRYETTSYIIIHYNPPMQVGIIPPSGDGDSATIQ